MPGIDIPATCEGRYSPTQHRPFFHCPGGQCRGPSQPGTPPFFTTIVSLNALAAARIPPWNGTAALTGVNAASHSAPTTIPHVIITTRIMAPPNFTSARPNSGRAPVASSIGDERIAARGQRRARRLARSKQGLGGLRRWRRTILGRHEIPESPNRQSGGKSQSRGPQNGTSRGHGHLLMPPSCLQLCPLTTGSISPPSALALDAGRDVQKLTGAGIRSKDAAFDPAKSNSLDILASLAGLLSAPVAMGDPNRE